MTGITTSRRAIILFTDDTDASEALLHALHLLGDGPVYLPFPKDATFAERKGPQPQATDQQRKDWAVEALWGVRGRVRHGQQILLPIAWQTAVES